MSVDVTGGLGGFPGYEQGISGVVHEPIPQTPEEVAEFGPLFWSIKTESLELGPHLYPDGTCHFGVEGDPALTSIEVCFDDPERPGEPGNRYVLHPRGNGIFTGVVTGVSEGDLFGERVVGPWNPPHQTFNHNKLVLDPRSRAVTGQPKVVDSEGRPVEALLEKTWSPQDGHTPNPENSARYMPRGIIVGDVAWTPRTLAKVEGLDGTPVIYETHVRGATMANPDIPQQIRGTYSGFTHDSNLAHITGLGANVVQLLPIDQSADEMFLQQAGLKNYWGYNTLVPGAPSERYSSWGSRGGQVQEFMRMIDGLHAAGLQVVLDVVYNHTAEGDHRGGTFSLKGLDSNAFHRTPDGRAQYLNETWCGNTVDASNPRVRRLIHEVFRRYAQMGVDGFRVDLAASLARNAAKGSAVDIQESIFRDIEQDPILRDKMLIAEPWDCGLGGYQEREFNRHTISWLEWNGQYRDAMRNYWRGLGSTDQLARMLNGSDNPGGKNVNYITAHDGFTLRDLVTYNRTHNNRTDQNSYNYGVEGPTDDPKINAMRLRAMRSMLASVIFSVEVPMIRAGDEIGQTAFGNSDSYCVDGPTSWLDWELMKRPEGQAMLLSTSALIKWRRADPKLGVIGDYTGLPVGGPGTESEVAWFDINGDPHRYWNHGGVLGMYRSGIPTAVQQARGIRQGRSTLFYANGADTDISVALPPDPRYAGEYQMMFNAATGVALPYEATGETVRDRFILPGRAAVLLAKRM